MTPYPRTAHVVTGLQALLEINKIDAPGIVFELGKLSTTLESELNAQLELNDALAAKVAEWKSRAEKAEAALKAMEEDDRHLSKGNSTCA